MTDASRPTVGVLGGTGPLGRGLGMRLAMAGYDVVLGSRDATRAERAAAGLLDDHAVDDSALRGGPNRDAAARDVVIVAVPFDGVRPLLGDLGDVLAGTTVISCVNRLGFDAHGPQALPVDEGSAAQLIATLLPTARVFGAFHHIPAARLTRDVGPLDMDVMITGDDPDERVLDLVRAVGGVRPVVVGPLRLSRPIEELTAAIIAVNRRYKVSAGVRLTGLPD
ncbi:MAG TPA: NADPH-dependent F420 reductase [Euzebyales bacterium]